MGIERQVPESEVIGLNAPSEIVVTLQVFSLLPPDHVVRAFPLA